MLDQILNDGNFKIRKILIQKIPFIKIQIIYSIKRSIETYVW